MTVIRPNSISGINSITANGGDINLFRADGTKADVPIINNITAGVVTATKFVGPIEGNLSNGTINATSGTITGNLGVGGVLTYEDVTNIDSVGVITARNGVKTNVSPAITIRDGTTEKGYIGFNANDPFIGRKNGVGLSFQNNKIRPVDGDDGSPSNNTVDIGEPTYKFKDGYFAGNIVIGTAGKGIDFSATSDYTGAGSGTPGEIFSDYEEGTFTPRFQTSNGNWGGSMSSQDGSYTKIGNVVHIRFRIHWGSVSGSGTFRITALPFTVANTASNEGGGATIGWRSGFNYPRLTSFFRLNTQLLQFGYVDSSGSMGSFDLSVGAIASSGYVYCSGWYEVA